MARENHDMDFEDVLKQFEKTFSNCARGNTFYIPKSSNKVQHARTQISSRKALQLEPDFQELCEEIIHHIHLSRQTVRSSRAKNPNDLVTGVTKEVLRAEIRTTLSDLRSFQGTTTDDIDKLPSSQRATIVSLKRRLRESKESATKEQKRSKQLELSNKRLQNLVESQRSNISSFEESEKYLEKDIDELRQNNGSLSRTLSESHKSKQRLERLVAELRSELVSAHHETETARLDNEQLTSRVKHLEHRTKAAKASETAISSRIQELQEIQDEMLAHMASAQNGADVPAVQRALATLGDRRSRIVGRIATLLTKKNQSISRPAVSQEGTQEDSRNVTNMSSPVSDAEHSHLETDSRNDGNNAPVLGNVRSTSTIEDGGKRPFLNIFKANGDLTRTFTNRTSRKSVLANLEKTRVAVEKDTQALKEVITVKDSELERMEEELFCAKERADSLEKQLQRERHSRRQENRNMRNPAVEKAKVEMKYSSNSRYTNQTLFDWQGSPQSASSAEKVEGSTHVNAEIQMNRIVVEGSSSDSKDDLFPSESSTSMSNSLSV